MKKLLIALVLILVIAAVAFGVRTIGSRDETDAVDSKQAAELVEDDDDDEDTQDIAAGDRPEAGVYSYTGTGTESVDVLGGSTHEFPKEISVVVELDDENDCEWTANVVYVKQHIEEREYCTENGVMRDLGFTREIEFFNQLQETEFTCDQDAERLRTEAKEGDTWSWTCVNGTKATSEYTATALGTEDLTVGGEQVKTWHTKVVSKQSGETVGGDTSEFWLAETGLTVKFNADLDVKTKSVLGETNFQEKISYALTSLVPKEA